MASTDINIRFEQLTTSWARRLNELIQASFDKGRQPYLIALSRKMPRLLSWIKQNFNKTFGTQIDFSLINKVQIATELAIPFIMSETGSKEADFIIVDDIIVKGATLQEVARDIKTLTNRTARIAFIAKNESAPQLLSEIVDSDYQETPQLKTEELNSLIEYIGELLEKYELPLDMEFPILSLNFSEELDAALSRLSKFVENKHGLPNGFNVIATDTESTRFSILLNRHDGASINSDFIKFRVLLANTWNSTPAMEVFAPIPFTENELTRPCKTIPLFIDKVYASIWENTTSWIRNYVNSINSSSKDIINKLGLVKGFSHSLCVWANYLFSLSTYIKHLESLKVILGNFESKLSIENLVLVLGPHLAYELGPKLEELIAQNKWSEGDPNLKVDIPNSIIPENFKNNLEVFKTLTAIQSSTVEQFLTKVFTYEHFSNPLFTNEYIVKGRLIFGETISSLAEVMEPYITSSNHMNELHQWLDACIDSGRVVPRYFPVLGKNKELHWRRFFISGCRKIV